MWEGTRTLSAHGHMHAYAYCYAICYAACRRFTSLVETIVALCKSVTARPYVNTESSLITPAHSSSLQLTTVFNHHLLRGLSTARTDLLDRLYHVHAFSDATEDTVLAVEVRGSHGAEEELRTVGVGA